jgi:hypothetical protein
MLAGIPYNKRKNFVTPYSMQIFSKMKVDRIMEIVYNETNYFMREGPDFNRRAKKSVILKALSILNNPNRTVFNDKKTVTFK